MCGAGGFSCISINLEILGVWRAPVGDDVGWKLWDGVLAVGIICTAYSSSLLVR